MNEIPEFPKSWNKLTATEQREWILQNCIRTIPIEFSKDVTIKDGTLSAKDGTKINLIPNQTVRISKHNPDLIQDCQYIVDKLIITVFHLQNDPFRYFISFTNYHFEKWLSIELTNYVWSRLFGSIFSIGRKFGFIRQNKSKNRKTEE